MSIWKDLTDQPHGVRFGDLDNHTNFCLLNAVVRAGKSAAVQLKLGPRSAIYINGNTGGGNQLEPDTRVVPVTLTSVEYKRTEK